MSEIDLRKCKHGDTLISSLGAKLEYMYPTPWNGMTYLDHVVRYVVDVDGKSFGEKCYGTRTHDGFTYQKNRQPTDHDIVKIIPCMEFTRRITIDLNKPAELAIRNAMLEIEKLPADVRLTDAIVKLDEARNLVADYVDSLPIKSGSSVALPSGTSVQVIAMTEEEAIKFAEYAAIKRFNLIYDLLVSIGGADESDRYSFIHAHVKDKYECTEWRFCGKLGFGGKYRKRRNQVDCYSEDSNRERNKIIKELNIALDKI